MEDAEARVSPLTTMTPEQYRPFARVRRIVKRIPTYLADAIENPEWLAMFALGRILPVRRVYRKYHPVARPPAAVDRTIFDAPDIPTVAEALRVDGIFPGLNLPDAIVRAIRDFATETPCFGNMERGLEFRPGDHAAAEQQSGRSLLTGHYFERIEQCSTG
jgi:hypothetical protein